MGDLQIEREGHEPREDCFPCGSFRKGLVLIILATVVSYVPTTRADFIWDDEEYVTGNQAVQELGGLRRIWLEPGACPYYYPVTFTVFWVQAQLWGDHPLGYHLTHVILHSLNACLVAFILRALGVPGAVLGGLLFAIHPVQASTVAWVTELKNILSGFFYLAAFAAWLRAGSSWKAKGYWASLVLFIAAMLSKPIVCTLPAALLLVVWWKRDPHWRRQSLKTVPFFLVSAGISLATSWWERVVVRVSGAEYEFSWLERILIAGRSVWFHLGKIIWPFHLGPLYPKWEIDTTAWQGYLFPLSFFLLLLVLWWLRDRWERGPFAAAAYYSMTLGPMLGFFSFSGMVYSLVFNHHQYLAIIGPTALLAGLFSALARRRGSPSSMRVLAPPLVVAALYGILTFHQALLYQSGEALWRHNVAADPEIPKPRVFLGLSLLGQGKVEEALAEFETALRLDPEDAQAHFNVAVALARMGQREGVVPHLREAVRLEPTFSNARFNLANSLALRGKHEEAVENFQELLRQRPAFFPAYIPFSRSLRALGRHAEAVEVLNRCLEIDPKRSEVHQELAVQLAGEGDFQDSFTHFERAISLSPSRNPTLLQAYAEALTAYGKSLRNAGENRPALDQFLKARDTWPRLEGLKELIEATQAVMLENGQNSGETVDNQ